METPLAQLSAADLRRRSEAQPGSIRTPGLVTVVVPVLNAMCFLPKTIPLLIEAARATPWVEILCVDNGSTDGSVDFLRSLGDECLHTCTLERDPEAAGRNLSAAARNFGARTGRGTYLSFLDADCIVRNDYFQNAIGVLEDTGAAATGCEVMAPPEAHWIEATWHDLHYVGRDRDVHYLNSANFFISRIAFEAIGGFNERLPSGADAEIGQRLTRAGYKIRESQAVQAIHLGNPKSIREFYRRTVWQSTGMLGTVNRRQIDKPTAMMVAQILATFTGLGILALAPWSIPARIVVSCALQFVVPSVTVAYRTLQTGRTTRLIQGVGLYWLYYWARIHALALLLLGRGHKYTK